MTAIITSQYRVLQAQQLRATIAAGADTYYLGIGKQLPWTTEASPDTPVDTFSQLATDYKDLLALKRIVAANVSLAIPIRYWTTGVVYVMYDDTNATLGTSAFFTTTSDFNVYKCLYSTGSPSTVMPTGTATTEFTTADGYTWKYMTNISASALNLFPSQNWVPIKTLTSADASTQWTTQAAAIHGAIHVMLVTNGGAGYTSNQTGIGVTITGDGTGAVATANADVSGVVISITVSNVGINYTNATITIAPPTTGTTATGRPIISPFGGHGKNVEQELYSTYCMLAVTLNLNEVGFTTDNDYRKIVMVKNPYQFGTTTIATATTLDSSTKLTFASTTGNFTVDELVTQATSGATGRVIDWTSTTKVLRLNNISGTFNAVNTVTGGTSGIVGSTPAITTSELEPNSGVLFYKDYRKLINRSIDQRESISVILAF